MSLFQYGFCSVSSTSSTVNRPAVIPSHIPSIEESGLGRVEYDNILASGVADLTDPSLPAAKKARVPRGKYTTYSPEMRAAIGKYALENGNERARRHFLSQYPNLNESSVRNFKKAYMEQLRWLRKTKQTSCPITALTCKPKGRPPILLDLDRKLIMLLKAIHNKGGVVNIYVVRATTKALIASNSSCSQHLLNFDMPRSWVKSIYSRMGYTKRMGTTARPPVPKGLYNECRLTFLQDIDDKIKHYNIPAELVFNADQTPSSYVSVGRSTMAKSGSTSVPIKGLSDKRNITLTFVVTLAGEFLPMQIIYGGKTNKSQPRGFKFPSGFLISQNPKHWSNEEETIKLIEHVIKPYIVEKRKELQLADTQKALVVWDVFRGQITNTVLQKLDSLNIEFVPVPANMTHFFQPLDLTVNRAAKHFMRNEFITYYSDAVKRELDKGTSIEDIDIDLRLTTIKPLHAQWVVNMYNSFTTEKGIKIIMKGWAKSGILGLLDGTTKIQSNNPFCHLYSQ